MSCSVAGTLDIDTDGISLATSNSFTGCFVVLFNPTDEEIFQPDTFAIQLTLSAENQINYDIVLQRQTLEVLVIPSSEPTSTSFTASTPLSAGAVAAITVTILIVIFIAIALIVMAIVLKRYSICGNLIKLSKSKIDS